MPTGFVNFLGVTCGFGRFDVKIRSSFLFGAKIAKKKNWTTLKYGRSYLIMELLNRGNTEVYIQHEVAEIREFIFNTCKELTTCRNTEKLPMLTKGVRKLQKY